MKNPQDQGKLKELEVPCSLFIVAFIFVLTSARLFGRHYEVSPYKALKGRIGKVLSEGLEGP